MIMIIFSNISALHSLFFIIRSESKIAVSSFIFFFAFFLIFFLFCVLVTCLEWIVALVTTKTSTVHCARYLPMMAGATFRVAGLHWSLTATPNNVHQFWRSWRLIRGHWYGMPSSFTFHPNLVMSRSWGAVWSAAFTSIVCRWARKMCWKRFTSVGGSDMILRCLPGFLVYR